MIFRTLHRKLKIEQHESKAESIPLTHTAHFTCLMQGIFIKQSGSVKQDFFNPNLSILFKIY